MLDKLLIADIEIEVLRKNIKNLHLSVLPPSGKVRITAPYRTKDEAIRLFASAKIGWIKKHLVRFENLPTQTERKYVTGESHYLWGKKYSLEIQHVPRTKNVEIIENRIVVTISNTSTEKQRENVMNEWYRDELKATLPTLIKRWETTIGVKASSVNIKNMRTRWGTCNTTAKRVWINLQLAKTPIDCLEYVVVHELVHLLEKNHTSIFKGYMDAFLPNWRIVKKELNSFNMGVD